MIERIERLSLAGMALGFAVLMVPIVVTVGSELALWNHILAGGAILLLTRYVTTEAAESPTRATLAAGATAVLGAWLVGSAIAYPGGLAIAFWSKIVAGVLVAVIGVATVLSMRSLDLPTPAAST